MKKTIATTTKEFNELQTMNKNSIDKKAKNIPKFYLKDILFNKEKVEKLADEIYSRIIPPALARGCSATPQPLLHMLEYSNEERIQKSRPLHIPLRLPYGTSYQIPS